MKSLSIIPFKSNIFLKVDHISVIHLSDLLLISRIHQIQKTFSNLTDITEGTCLTINFTFCIWDDDKKPRKNIRAPLENNIIPCHFYLCICRTLEVVDHEEHPCYRDDDYQLEIAAHLGGYSYLFIRLSHTTRIYFIGTAPLYLLELQLRTSRLHFTTSMENPFHL